MDRRGFIAMILMGSTAVSLTSLGAASSASGNFEVTRTEAEWRNMLTDLQYKVMREEGTEPAGSSPLDKHYGAGTYHCRGCDLPLYPSDTKFDSKTGWPSFYRPLENAVETKRDFKLIYPRTEVHCRRCGSHLGHIFNDGPEPTGKRHCLNGVSLVFKPA
ncbi:MAG: peptide-methionine (R)-S-oxide reductase MsrB [Roseovarius sp.]